ncbi:hypothetical protein DCAR_0101850 [Daucus carota subsp. sativus]|uniref:Transcription factor GTE7-like n=1 Tax=Daucus carota subsp. sativus TaxID=79200 RepID=A0AAF0W407_DAUCS|nr:PREDICTED: transcription factor GTE2-like [Daucus carota subsp. sativus]WOG82684.1 hypothetical protein DCAR_0101850 [Daucus carota subsp. sativus]
MESTVMSNRNESSWGQSLGKFMTKTVPLTNPNPNPISNPSNHKHLSKSSKKKKQFHALNGRHDESPVVIQSVADDAYSYNQRPLDTNHGDAGGFNHAAGGFVNIKVSTCSKAELRELKRKLQLELKRVRELNDRIESRQLVSQLPPRSSNEAPQFPPRSNHGKMKKLSGQKRMLPLGPPQIQSQLEQNLGVPSGNIEGIEEMMKSCRQILIRLMKHKHSWVFNKPVDAAALGLHDYHLIVKKPMDLGTVKMNFGKNLYSSPAEFASDVRLTFNNAMLYNPKTDEVHRMAAQLLSEFETKFGPIQDKLDQISTRKERSGFANINNELQGSSWNEIVVPHSPPRPKKPKTSLVNSIPRKVERIPEPLQKPNQSSGSNPTNSNPPVAQSPRIPQPAPKPNLSSGSNPSNSNPRSAQSPVTTPSPVEAQPVKPTKPVGAVKGASTTKLPKPRAKDSNKREMTMEEKQMLGVGLQNLPQEKMPQLVQIIRKRNEQLSQEGDEIELDIEALDTETLWELDRFVTNWKKLVSKTKRQALMENYSAVQTVTTDTDEAPASTRNDGSAKNMKKGEGDEDVDIGDEMPENSFPPVEIEKDDGGHGQDNGIKNGTGNGNASSSSSSSGSSGSDSSSSSDSGSSSGSDSDADEAQS